MSKVILPLAVALLGAVFLVQATSAAHPTDEAKPAVDENAAKQKSADPQGPLPVLNHWFALGSGCKAKHDVAGDVTMEVLPQDPARPNVYRARFHLDQYKLDSSALGAEPPVKFARECSVRLNINPPAGMKVTNVTAKTSAMVETKEPGTKLTSLTELKIGHASLGRNERVFGVMEAVQGKVESVKLVPGSKPEEKFPVLQCAEPKIIAFNYTMLAERGAITEPVNVHLAGDKTLEIEAELSPCTQAE